MNEQNYAIIGYHGTCSKHYESINENGLDPSKVKHRDDHWLGQGVYFFENQNLAEWWANDQASKKYNNGTYPIVYKSDIHTNEKKVLNLDDEAQLDTFYDFCIELLKSVENSDNSERPVFDEKKIRAVFFDYYKIKNNIDVIIYTFTKPTTTYAKQRSREELKKIVELTGMLQLSYKEKQICVSNKECIKSTELVYNGEYEVI